MIGIIGAMDEEILEIKKIINIKEEKEILGVRFYLGCLDKKEVILVKSKIGKVASSYVATLLINNFDVEYIINIGTCGAVSRNLKYLDIVVGEKLFYHDVDVTAFGYKYGQMAQCEPFFNSNLDLVDKAKKFNNVYVGDIVSGDEFVDDNKKMQEKIQKYFSEYNILACDMESTSIAHVATLSNTPFIIIRTISDVLDFEGTKRDFGELALESCKILAHFIKEYING